MAEQCTISIDSAPYSCVTLSGLVCNYLEACLAGQE